MTYFEEMLNSFEVLHHIILDALMVEDLFRPEERARLAEALLSKKAVHDVLQQKRNH